MQKDCPPSWISGRILQGRGQNEVMSVRRHPLWCMPDQPITGRGMKEIVTARSWIHHTLPEGLPLCPMTQSAMGHIHPLYIGVWCDRGVKGAVHGKETTMTNPVGEAAAVRPFRMDVPE